MINKLHKHDYVHSACLVVVDDFLFLPAVQHLLVPLDEALWPGDLLLHRVAVEYVVVAFAWRAGPNMGILVPIINNYV